MFRTGKVTGLLIMVSAIVMLMFTSGCEPDDTTPESKISYMMKSKDVLGVSGIITFTRTGTDKTTIVVTLTGAPSGTHPVEFRTRTVIEGGTLIAELNPIDETGTSTTVYPLAYSSMILYDGYIQVVESEENPGVILAQADIGGNLLTNYSQDYPLVAIGNYGVSGTALFEKRLNGSTVVTIDVDGLLPGKTYPATINLGSITSVGGGPVVKILSDVNGSTGKSYSNIRILDNETGDTIRYEDWLMYDGYINIYNDSISNSSIICHGNIGSN